MHTDQQHTEPPVELGVTYTPRYPDKINGSTEQSPAFSTIQSQGKSHSNKDGFPSQGIDGLSRDEKLDKLLEERVREFWHTKLLQAGKQTTSIVSSTIAERVEHRNRNSSINSYLHAHTIWTPEVQVDHLLEKSNDPITAGNKACQRNQEPNTDQFTAYIHLTGTISEAPIPPLFYHSSVAVDQQIYVLGGVRTIYGDRTPGDIEISSWIQLETPLDPLPTPLNGKILNSLMVIPNKECFRVSSETHVVRKFKVSGDYPPPLLCATVNLLSDRYAIYYGGFELCQTVRRDMEVVGMLKVSLDIAVNENCYILDLRTFRFTKHNVIPCPSSTMSTPILYSRFAHASDAAMVDTSTTDTASTTTTSTTTTSNTTTSTVTSASACTTGSSSSLPTSALFVMSGYHYSSELRSFKAIADLWKFKVDVVFCGNQGYIEFGPSVVATPLWIGDYNCNGLGPQRRGFHVVNLIETRVFSPNTSDVDTADALMPIPENLTGISETSTTKLKLAKLSELSLIIHGGSDERSLIHGDIWSFSFADSSWSQIDTYFNEVDSQFNLLPNYKQSLVRKCGHVSFVFDRYLVLMVGAIPSDFTQPSPFYRGKNDLDISDLFIHLKDAPIQGRERPCHRYFILDLSSRKWFLYKCFHQFSAWVSAAQSQLSYIGILGGSAVLSNSRVYYIGGVFVSNLELTQQTIEKPNNSKNISRDQTREIANNAIEIIDYPLSCFEAENWVRERLFLG